MSDNIEFCLLNKQIDCHKKEIFETLSKGGTVCIKKNKDNYIFYQNLIKKIK